MKIFLIPVLGATLVACADTQAFEPQHTPIETATGSVLTQENLHQIVEQAMATTNTPGMGLVVINGGEIVHDGVYGVEDVRTSDPVTHDTVFEAASLSKPLFGFLTMTFVEDGVLDLDRPLYEYLPHRDIEHDARYRQMTARHVLSHQTGFPNWRSDTPDLGLHLKFTPGQGFFYSGEGYEYLADVLMHLADTDDAGLEALYQTRIAQPLGMVRSEFIASSSTLERRAIPHRDGEPLDMGEADPTFGAAYSLHSDARDYAQFVLGMMEERVLEAQSYDRFYASQSSPIPADDPARALGLSDWALGFSVYELPMGRFYIHGGNNPGYTSFVAFNPESGWGVVLFTNANQANDLIQVVVGTLSGLE